MRRIKLAILVSILVSIAAAVITWAKQIEHRGVNVTLRTEESPNAPVAETVELYDKSYALIIGIDDYTGGWPRLNYAVADAHEIAKELAQRGFEVTLKTNLNSTELQQSLKEFFALRGADPDARLLLWYAGHGHTIKGEGFLVPADAPAVFSSEFKLKAVHLRDFGGYMRLAESKHVFAVFDSCFAGTIFVTRAGATPAAITRATTKPVRQFLSSGDADQTVSDDGTFRKLFLRALRGEERADANGDGYLTGSELGLYLSDRVTNVTEQAQTPRYGKLRDPDYDRGDFVFVLPAREMEEKRAVTEELPPIESQEVMAEIIAWARIAASDDVADFESYLQKYPDGYFANNARDKIDSLKATKISTPLREKQETQIAEEQKPLQISTEQHIVEVTPESSADEEWVPIAPSQKETPLRIVAQTQLDPLASVGPRAGALSPEEKSAEKVAVMRDDLQVDRKQWSFSNPQGDGAYKIDGKWIHMKVGGGHNIWDCNRGRAPILSVKAPATDAWSAQVKFEMPSRVGRSQVGLVLWNKREKAPVHALAIGPTETGEVMVAGSYRDDCSGHSYDLAKIRGNSGEFQTSYTGSSGWLRVSKKGSLFSFYFKSPYKKQWQELGTVLATVKDGFNHVGLMMKTWGNQSVQVSFSNFLLMPGVAGISQWAPEYFSKLEESPEVSLSRQDFATDFEWSDPQGDSLHEITQDTIRMKTQGGHNTWDCNRGLAPMLTVETPPAETWTAQVKFEMPTRVGRSHVGLALWNGREDKPVHVLSVGPAETQEVSVSGSYRDDCSAHSYEMVHIKGNSGEFKTKYEGSDGWLRISRRGDTYDFYFKSPHGKQWRTLSSVQTTAKDGFSRIGLMTKTWGGQAVDVRFSKLKIITGVAETRPWIPAYFSRLTSGEPEVFSGRKFSDFEWSDPLGDSRHEIRGTDVHMKVNGGHNIWDCKRGLAPMLTVKAPPREAWVTQVKFSLPKRVSRSHVGLVLWNGSDDHPVNALYMGPMEAGQLGVSGSYQDDCSAHYYDLAKTEGNSGPFMIKSAATNGSLRIIKTGKTFRFSVRLANEKQWHELGSVLTTVKDEFNRVGLITKTWGGEPVEVTLSNLTILPGRWQ